MLTLVKLEAVNNIKPIRNDYDLRAAFKRLELVYQASEGTPA
jgi:HTH-type transcriptional regulator/antitoxin HigA